MRKGARGGGSLDEGSMKRFRDRAEAGERLAQGLARYRESRPLVLGLPRGGVVVAAAVARALGGELDVVVTRKVGVPSNPEVGVGAVGPDGARHFDLAAISRLALALGDLYPIAEREEEEVRRRTRAYREERPPPEVAGRTVILVDDGVATGVTSIAAAKAVRRRAPARLVLASPVCSPEGAERLKGHFDEVVCLHVPASFRAVGEFYEAFDPTEDDEVVALLQAGAKARML